MSFVGEEQLLWLLRKTLHLGFCVLHSTVARIWNAEVYSTYKPTSFNVSKDAELFRDVLLPMKCDF